MIWRIEICNRADIFDAIGEGIKKDIEDLGYKRVRNVKIVEVYLISGDVKETDASRIANELLVDKVTQQFSINSPVLDETGSAVHKVEVAHNPGVMDPVEESTLKGICDMGIEGVDTVRTARKFLIQGGLTQDELNIISEKLLYNKVIQHVVVDPNDTEYLTKGVAGYSYKLGHVDILKADDKELMRISKEGQLFLNLEEMRVIRDYFSKIGRKPTDCELESLAQTWSEHCKHKTFMGIIDYNGKIIDNLLKETIMKVTKELNKDWCVSVFKDNAGIIRFDEEHDVCFKVETHNHPSALEPYGGAGTGIGGVIRDPLGTGLGAKPIINTDVFCFGPPDYPYEKLPKGVLHPKRVMKGVVGGVRDYGNRMGIPTSNGAVLFDDRYLGNPLVFCGNVGLMPKGTSEKRVDPGDLIVLVGGRTGRDGIHGATFSSGALTAESEEVSSSAVQIGNPITEKKVTDTILQARDKGLYKAITDCGAGGISSAVGEMGEKTGAEVSLDKVPLKYNGLSYTEIWISEAQERMVLAVDQARIEELLEVFRSENVEATVIGRFTDTKRLHLTYSNDTVADLDMGFLHHGLPRLKRKAVWMKPDYQEPFFKEPKTLGRSLKNILSGWNVCSKEWIIRQYDHEVQGGSVLKPLQGVDNDGPGDASITKPLLGSKKGIIVSNGINPRYGLIDPYHMAASAIDEALRQIIAVGGNLKRVAILDNFCWGNTDKPDRLGGLVRAAFACYDAASVYQTPFISGKDSLNNEYVSEGGTIAIPPTLLISAIGVMEDVSKAVTMDLKKKDNLIYAIGVTKDEMGGSHYYYVNGHVGKNVPIVDAEKGKKLMDKLSNVTAAGLIASCHDCSEGGIGVTLAEMAFSGGLGADVKLKNVPREAGLDRNDKILFSESNSRFIVEVSKKNKKRFEKMLSGIPIGLIGKTDGSGKLKITGLKGHRVIEEKIMDLKKAWQKPFKNM